MILGKIYVVVAFAYAVRGMILTKETVPTRIAGEFLKNLLLFPLNALIDIVGKVT